MQVNHRMRRMQSKKSEVEFKNDQKIRCGNDKNDKISYRLSKSYNDVADFTSGDGYFCRQKR